MTPEQVHEALGLDHVPAEIIDWFGWANGVTNPSRTKTGGHFGPGLPLLSLEEAVGEWRLNVQIYREDFRTWAGPDQEPNYRELFLPILARESPVVADLDADQTVPILRFVSEGDETKIADSLLEAIQAWTVAVTEGYWVYDPSGIGDIEPQDKSFGELVAMKVRF